MESGVFVQVADFFRESYPTIELIRILKLWLDAETEREAQDILIQYQDILVTDAAITVMRELNREMMLAGYGKELYPPAYTAYHQTVLIKARMEGLANAWHVPTLAKSRHYLRTYTTKN